MSGKHIILVHGRDIKPSEAAVEKLARLAISSGLRRAHKADWAKKFDDGAVKLTLAYYGDLNNRILAENDKKTASKLLDSDPRHDNAPCFPADVIEEAFRFTDKISEFDAAAYRKVLSNNTDFHLLDEAADTVSMFGALLTGGLLNTTIINMATSDMGAYLTSHSVGSAVRARLDEPLRNALSSDDDVCLLSHSMGCIVAYDLMWKYAHMMEYEQFRSQQRKVDLWLTIGNPLGETGVRRNLLDGRYPEVDKYPRNQVLRWVNIYAEDDYVAHIEKVAPLYKSSKSKDTGLQSISDTHIYNCWAYSEVKSARTISNPHDLYGYLMNQSVGATLASWLEA